MERRGPTYSIKVGSTPVRLRFMEFNNVHDGTLGNPWLPLGDPPLRPQVPPNLRTSF
jgi:hypothetical protein